MPSTDWVPRPPAVMEPSAFPEQGGNMYFLLFLSLVFSQSSPKRNHVSCCTGWGRLQTQPAEPPAPCHLHKVFLFFYCDSCRELTKQNPRRLPNAEKWLKIEHNNYYGKRPRTQVLGGSCFCSQTPPRRKYRSAQGWTPTWWGGLGQGVCISWLISIEEPEQYCVFKGHLESSFSPARSQRNSSPTHTGLPISLHLFILHVCVIKYTWLKTTLLPCLYKSNYTRNLTQEEPYTVSPFVTGLFH